MNQLMKLCQLELSETFRARWYQFYLLTVALMISLFFYFGLAESRILGFTGLGRILLTLIQISIIVLPIFTMMTTVRTLVSDKETGVWEYNLSLPLKLSSFYWGRALGKFLALYIPLFLGMMAAALISLGKGFAVPWNILILYTLFIGANLLCFTGMALLLSVFSRSQEMAIGLGFILWLLFEAMIDALLLGLLLKQRVIAEVILGVAFLNPLQSFRMGAIGLFDPELTVLGPISYTIIEKVGLNNLLTWAVLWPCLVGLGLAFIGYQGFKKRDLL